MFVISWSNKDTNFAMFHREFDITQKVLSKTEGVAIKDLVRHIVVLDEWEQASEPLLEGMVLAKFLQNPELMDKLVATYPHPLIEATRDSNGGGGGLPVRAPEYDIGIL